MNTHQEAPPSNSIPRRPRDPDTPPTPMLSSAVRDEARDSGRDDTFVRRKVVERHRRFELPDHRRERGKSYQWCSTKIPFTTLKDPRLQGYFEAGWRPVRAADVPELSGYSPAPAKEGDAAYEARLVELGLKSKIAADDPVIIDNQVLMMRPEQLSKEADRERESEAKQLINDHLRQQREASERQIGRERTVLRQDYGPPDEAPSDYESARV